ncbi:MAG: hypothetical protein AB4352_01845 [Hormoscilla sp.]
MSYSQFTSISKVKEAFDLTIRERVRFFPDVAPIQPSPVLEALLANSVPWAIAVSTEKARSEAIINPVLLEVRRILEQQISVFSGEDLTVEPSVGLTGVCDFLISRSPLQLELEAPVIVVVEAKKEDLKAGLGQCIAEMVAVQKFNQAKGRSLPKIYGSITSGTQWRFLQLCEQTVTIDLTDYPLPPVAQILGFLVWMIQSD